MIALGISLSEMDCSQANGRCCPASDRLEYEISCQVDQVLERTIIGFAPRVSLTKIRSGGNRGESLSTACWNIVRSPTNLSDCLERVLRLKGHNRVPLPPAMISA